MDRERVSLSLKATQEDPWQHFARTHAIGQVVPGRVTKLVPFGAFVRVAEGIEGLVHISELAERHVEIPEQIVTVNDEIFVKVIDIDLERRRISLSLKQANEDAGAETTDEFDPYLYGMPASYDEQGAYIGPEGFDPVSGEWKEGFEDQRTEGSSSTRRPTLAGSSTRSRSPRPRRPTKRQKPVATTPQLPVSRLVRLTRTPTRRSGGAAGEVAEAGDLLWVIRARLGRQQAGRRCPFRYWAATSPRHRAGSRYFRELVHVRSSGPEIRQQNRVIRSSFLVISERVSARSCRADELRIRALAMSGSAVRRSASRGDGQRRGASILLTIEDRLARTALDCRVSRSRSVKSGIAYTQCRTQVFVVPDCMTIA